VARVPDPGTCSLRHRFKQHPLRINGHTAWALCPWVRRIQLRVAAHTGDHYAHVPTFLGRPGPRPSLANSAAVGIPERKYRYVSSVWPQRMHTSASPPPWASSKGSGSMWEPLRALRLTSRPQHPNTRPAHCATRSPAYQAPRRSHQGGPSISWPPSRTAQDAGRAPRPGSPKPGGGG